MVPADLDVREDSIVEPHAEESIIEVFPAGGKTVAVNSRSDRKRSRRHAPGEPKNFIDVVNRHIGQDAPTLISVRRGIRIFKRGVDLENLSDDTGLH
jgi:hypothetical protein